MNYVPYDTHLTPQVDVEVFSDEDCQSFYDIDEVTDMMLCAGHLDGGKDACQVNYWQTLYYSGTIHFFLSKGRLRRAPDPKGQQPPQLRAGRGHLLGLRVRAAGAARSLRQSHGYTYYTQYYITLVDILFNIRLRQMPATGGRTSSDLRSVPATSPGGGRGGGGGGDQEEIFKQLVRTSSAFACRAERINKGSNWPRPASGPLGLLCLTSNSFGTFVRQYLTF